MPFHRPQPSRRQPTLVREQRKYTPPPQPKKCTTLECQISDIRSQTAVWDLSLKTALGRKLSELEAALQKKTVML